MIQDTRVPAPHQTRRPVSVRASAVSGWPDLRSQLASIVEHSNDAIFSRTFSGIVTSWNAAAERIFGFRAKEMIGRSSRVLVPRGQHDEFRRLIARIREGEVVEHYETERLRKGRLRIHVSLTLSPVRDSRGRMVGFSTIARDVSEERRMKELLAQREYELQDLFEEASVGLVFLDRRGSILRTNKAFQELLGCAGDALKGRSLRNFLTDDDWLESILTALASRCTIQNAATELRTHKGQVHPVLVDANALWEQGHFIHSRWFVRDISRRKQLERELLESSERERRGLAQELHDGLGQQLGGVAYLCNVLREKLTEKSAPEAAEANRIFSLVRAAIEQTRRISRGLSPIRPEPDGLLTALHELARQTTELFRVRCSFHAPPSMFVPDVEVAGHLFRIAQEAVNNALKHGKPRRISIRLRWVRNNLRLVVADDGIGIGPLSPTRHGLGLHIMQYRAGLIHGAVTVEPRRGGGTEVTCSAPCPKSFGRTKRDRISR